MRRASIPEEERKQVHLFIDEAGNYMSESFSTMLSEIRKYKVSLFISTQFLSQLDLEIKNAILANVGTKIIFRVGMEDARLMEKEFHPVFNYEDFINLPKYYIYVRLMIDGSISRGFSAVTSIEF
jgi:DNA helicase HerA-like ATPase